jgi:hypothetical protein
MKELFTKNELLIQALYEEISIEDGINLQFELANNQELRTEYDFLKQGKQRIPKVQFNPSDAVLDRILNYSRTAPAEHYC